MINANELRIGNVVYTAFNPKGMKVPTVLDADYFRKVLDYGGNEFYSIPLSPEILEAAGFEQTSNFHPEGPIHTIKHKNGITFEVCYLYHMVDVVENIGRIRIQNIKYLHQLQNLIWCLCGEELEIKNFVEV